MIVAACFSARSSKRCAQGMQLSGERIDRFAQPQPQVRRDLVVARTRGVQPFARVADERDQPLLDVGVHVLQIAAPDELAALDLGCDRAHAVLDRGQIGGADDACGGQHAGVRKRGRDVHPGETPIEVSRCVEALHSFRHWLIEATGACANGRGFASGLTGRHGLPRRGLLPTIAGRQRMVPAAARSAKQFRIDENDAREPDSKAAAAPSPGAAQSRHHPAHPARGERHSGSRR